MIVDQSKSFKNSSLTKDLTSTSLLIAILTLRYPHLLLTPNFLILHHHYRIPLILHHHNLSHTPFKARSASISTSCYLWGESCGGDEVEQNYGLLSSAAAPADAKDVALPPPQEGGCCAVLGGARRSRSIFVTTFSFYFFSKSVE